MTVLEKKATAGATSPKPTSPGMHVAIAVVALAIGLGIAWGIRETTQQVELAPSNAFAGAYDTPEVGLLQAQRAAVDAPVSRFGDLEAELAAIRAQSGLVGARFGNLDWELGAIEAQRAGAGQPDS
jgi:hypothetical protein